MWLPEQCLCPSHLVVTSVKEGTPTFLFTPRSPLSRGVYDLQGGLSAYTPEEMMSGKLAP